MASIYPNANWTDNSGYTHLELYPNGNYRSFIPEIDTEWMVGDICLLLKAACKVKFFIDGGLEECVLSSTTKLSAFGVPIFVRGGTALSFHASGEIRRATIDAPRRWFSRSKQWAYRGALYDVGSELELAEDGTVVRVSKK